MKDSQPTVRKDTLWLPKRTKQSLGIFLEKCRVFVGCFSKEWILSLVESGEAKDITSDLHQGELKMKRRPV